MLVILRFRRPITAGAALSALSAAADKWAGGNPQWMPSGAPKKSHRTGISTVINHLMNVILHDDY
ncbi:MAG TPA: hypothetical protein VHE37_16830 [Nevskiaceae bacterium]|nr:hypothetical protein [Nevskiaceae bacterium]